MVSGLWARRTKDWSLITPIYPWPRRWAPHGSVDRRLWALLRHRPHPPSPPTVVYVTKGAVEAKLRAVEAPFERTVCLKGKPERFELLLLWLASVLSVRFLPPHPTGVHGP